MSPAQRSPSASAAEFLSTVVAREQLAGVRLSLLHQDSARELPRHGHENAYFSFLVSGSYRERIGCRELTQRPPSVVFHPPGFEHADAYGSRGGRILAVEVEPPLFEEWTGFRAARSDASVVSGDRVLPAAWGLYRALAAGDVPLALDVESRLADLLASFLASERPDRRPPAWLKRIVDRLRAEYAAPPSLSALAREASIHPAHLSRTFRRFRGCSPTAFVQRLRVRHVWRRLVDEDAPALADVALEAGFSDQSHCTRTFQRLVGSSPGRFRKELRSASPRSGVGSKAAPA